MSAEANTEAAAQAERASADGRPNLASAKRVVIKIGSSLVVDRETGQIRDAWLAALADDIAELRGRGAEVLVVSSGAIALGRRLIGLRQNTLELEQSQAAAAVGQIHLAHAYQTVFAARGITCGQILLTLTDTEQRRRYLNARRTIETLITQGAVAIVNENDTVATTEIRYGDNDRLSARVASMASADCLVLLSDVDGLYTAAPNGDSAAEHIPCVRDLSPDVWAMAGGAASSTSRGGMITKLEAARIAMAAGTNMVIASGLEAHPLRRICDGARTTWFIASTDPVTARKRWIGGQLQPAGEIRVDAGAEAALARGKSLLPAGVVSVSGDFERGDAVRIVTPDGREVGRGLVAYSRDDAEKIVGRRSDELPGILGYTGRSVMVHRDDMVTNRTSQR